MPPARARAMARRASVTVSIAADTIGMASSMRGVSRVQVRTSFGMTDDSAGTSSTSSKVRPCLANFGGYAPGPSASSVNGVGAASIGGPFVSGPFSDPTGASSPTLRRDGGWSAASDAREPDAEGRPAEPVAVMPRPYRMSPDEFRRQAHEAVEWVARYMERVEDLPVRAQVEPGEVRAALAAVPAGAPRGVGGDPGRPRPGGGARHHPLAVAQLLRLLQRQHVRPGRHRRPRGRRPRRPGDALVDRPGLHRGGDARPRLAGRAARPARALPVDAVPAAASIQDGASGANLCALLAARERAGGVARHADLVAYTSGEAHSSVEKGARVAGLRPDQLRLVPVDPATRAMRPDRLRAMHRGGRGRRAASRSSCAPPSAPPPPTPSTRSTRSRTSPSRPGRGCTSTPPTPARRRSAPSSARSTTASSGRTATAWTRTSGCSPAWSATPSASPTARR